MAEAALESCRMAAQPREPYELDAAGRERLQRPALGVAARSARREPKLGPHCGLDIADSGHEPFRGKEESWDARQGGLP